MVLLYVSTMVVISMAIIIPSRNIYDKNHNKIRDNVIDNVEIDGTEVVPDNHYDEVVANLSYTITDDTTQIEQNSEDNRFKVASDAVLSGSGASGTYYYAFAYLDIKAIYVNVEVTIQRQSQIGQVISKIKTSKTIDESGNTIPDIKYSVKGSTYTQPISATYIWSRGAEDVAVLSDIVRDNDALTVDTGTLSLNEIPYEYSFAHPNRTQATAKITSDLTNKTNIVDTKVTETEEYYTMNLYCLAGTRIDEMGGYATKDMYDFDQTTTVLSGTSIYQYPKEIQLTFYGNTIGIDLVDKTVKIGSGSHPFSIGGNNELLQTSNYIDTVDCKAIDTDYGKTLTEYSNGKETVTLLCDISDYYSDYYNERKNKVIAIDNSTEKMCFRMYDIVEPYVFGADGKDKPLSKNKDGSPKQFQVLGVKPIYDGAVWQELTLQEV